MKFKPPRFDFYKFVPRVVRADEPGDTRLPHDVLAAKGQVNWRSPMIWSCRTIWRRWPSSLAPMPNTWRPAIRPMRPIVRSVRRRHEARLAQSFGLVERRRDGADRCGNLERNRVFRAAASSSVCHRRTTCSARGSAHGDRRCRNRKHARNAGNVFSRPEWSRTRRSARSVRGTIASAIESVDLVFS